MECMGYPSPLVGETKAEVEPTSIASPEETPQIETRVAVPVVYLKPRATVDLF
jgi:hypothetical protein